MKQGTVLVPLAIAVIAGLASCASSEPRPDQQDAEASITPVDAGLVPPDDGLGEMPGWHMEWVVQAGGADSRDMVGDRAFDITADGAGNIFLTGHLYSETATFGAGTSSKIVLNPYEVGCVFTARCSADGEPQWVSTIKTRRYEGSGVAINDLGPLVVGHLKTGPVIFGEGEPNETKAELTCTDCPFIAQYARDGEFAWALVPDASPDSRARINDVAVTSENTICAVGNWREGKISFGLGVELIPPADGRNDGFLLSLGNGGSLRWMRRFTGPGETGFDAVAASADGGCVVLAHYESHATYETDDGESETVVGPASYRMELAQYDRDGVLIWRRDIGVDGKSLVLMPDSMSVRGMLYDDLRVTGDAIAVVGSFSGIFDWDQPQAVTLGRTTGGFIALFDINGGERWVRTMVSNGLVTENLGGKWHSHFGAVERMSDGTWATGGRFSGERRLAAGQPEEVLLDAKWHNDGLLAGWSDEGRLLWWRELSGKNEAYNLTGTQVWIMSLARSGEALYVTGGFTGAVRFGARSSDSKVLTSWGSFDIFLMKLVPLDGPR